MCIFVNNKEPKIAYLRSLDSTSQCNLTFHLAVTHSEYGSIDKEIKSVRQIKDNVANLLVHTKNQIIKLFQDNGNQEVQADKLDTEMGISLSRNDVEFSGDMPCIELLKYKNKIKFKIFNCTYRIIVNAPLIYTLTIPNYIYANTSVKPLRLKGIHFDKRLSKYKWSKSKDKIHWTDIYYEINCNTTLEEVGFYLKLTCTPYSKEQTGGPIVEVVSENVIDILPDVPSESNSLQYRKKYTQNKLTGDNIRVVSYNILSERYTDESQFAYCDSKFLAFDYRKQLILKELMNYQADIICLQEVDEDHYNSYFKNHFKNNDYISVFYRKGHLLSEGLSLIYDRNRFKKLECKHIVLSQQLKSNPLFRDIWNLLKKRKEVKELFIKQHTSLLVIALKLIGTNNVVLVANTHLYYHFQAGHIRLLQVVMALKYIKQISETIQAREGSKVSVIFCGDFNSRPDSAVYEFLSQNKVEMTDENLQRISVGQSNIYKHNFNFTSACGTPEFTNYTDDFKDCLDYIFCEKHIKISQVIPFPPEEELSSDIALPNKYFPSDHIALVTDLKL